ncbi:MAG TPA: hypothetical protein VIK82_00215 [Porticoccaceae bacterium]
MMLALHLVVAVVIALAVIIRFRLAPPFGLILGALYYGIAAGLGARQTASLIAEGFGKTMAGLGLVIAFGVVIGDLMAASGALQRIIHTILSWFSPKRVADALLATGLVVSTPVFFDVGFVILAPIARRLAKMLESPIPMLLAPLVIGLGTAHMLIPPTPGPLAAANTLNVPLGTMIGMGALVGIPSAILAWILYRLIAGRPGFWRPEDEEPIHQPDVEEGLTRLPPFALAITPIAVPVLLILLASVVPILLGDSDTSTAGEILLFLGDRNIAMLLGAVVALAVAATAMTRDSLSKVINNSLNSAGVILVDTGTGGALGAVLAATDIGKVLANPLVQFHIPVVLLAWLIAAAIKTAQGSGTTAIITTASLMAPLVPQLGVNPVWVALAIGSGGLLGCHVNDSGFWVISKGSGLTTRGGFKVYTLATALNAVTSLAVILVLQAFLLR